MATRETEAVERAEKAEKALEWTRQWYADRFRRIEDIAKREGIWEEVACIYANGTASADEPPTYAQQLNWAKHRADKAVADYRKAQALLTQLLEAGEAVFDAVESCLRHREGAPWRLKFERALDHWDALADQIREQSGESREER